MACAPYKGPFFTPEPVFILFHLRLGLNPTSA
jgi:hypothetical protein